ncbi:MAG: cob(I)yrinic acid a,c-diamide adenosyltransferase [Candidatus Abyssobacteria bacterium SURF_5]|uniref:Corrinoid adenosyltransferase n=1 Tax=Abyssobacteria bacterium (strain SURF_5) TaxID=2093360 RepID=A0A3A4NR21_ABYX5|nr:MAG: cob(I)yrinic acid a,c-diamide adenosyltransferase [Candidatus Abyssubacteria bacterium SURF_5]
MKSFNKRGDDGTTSLLFGHRIPKYSPRPEAYGAIDEASSALGLARGLIENGDLKQIILDIQHDLFVVGSELAALPDENKKLKKRITREHTLRIESLIECYENLVEMPRRFVPPGGSPGAGSLDLARSTLRRAERRIAKLFDDGEVKNPEILCYCNRLADLLFTLARYEEGSARPDPQNPA